MFIESSIDHPPIHQHFIARPSHIEAGAGPMAIPATLEDAISQSLICSSQGQQCGPDQLCIGSKGVLRVQHQAESVSNHLLGRKQVTLREFLHNFGVLFLTGGNGRKEGDQKDRALYNADIIPCMLHDCDGVHVDAEAWEALKKKSFWPNKLLGLWLQEERLVEMQSGCGQAILDFTTCQHRQHQLLLPSFRVLQLWQAKRRA